MGRRAQRCSFYGFISSIFSSAPYSEFMSNIYIYMYLYRNILIKIKIIINASIKDTEQVVKANQQIMTLVRACVSLPILRCPRGIRVKREERRGEREERREERG